MLHVLLRSPKKRPQSLQVSATPRNESATNQAGTGEDNAVASPKQTLSDEMVRENIEESFDAQLEALGKLRAASKPSTPTMDYANLVTSWKSSVKEHPEFRAFPLHACCRRGFFPAFNLLRSIALKKRN